MRKLFIVLVSGVLAFAVMPNLVAQADGGDAKCYKTVVLAEAYTETINHPAVTHQETVTVVDTEAYLETIEHPAIPAVTRNDDTWYSYNPSVDVDENVSTGFPVGDRRADKDNGWQVNQGNHVGQYADVNFKVGEPWQEGNGGGSYFYVTRSIVTVVPGTAAWTETIEHSAVTHEETITVTDRAAWTETVEHPAVTEQVEVPCDEEPQVPEEPPVPGPEEPVVGPETPEPPKVKPAEAFAPKPVDEPIAVPTAVAAGL